MHPLMKAELNEPVCCVFTVQADIQTLRKLLNVMAKVVLLPLRKSAKLVTSNPGQANFTLCHQLLLNVSV